MNEQLQQRSIIRFLFLEGVCCRDIYKRLKKQFGKNTVSLSSVYFWVRKFRNGVVNVKDAQRTGRPKTSLTDGKLLKLIKL